MTDKTENPRIRAAALHEAGEPHEREDCFHCSAEAISKAMDQIRENVAAVFERIRPHLEAFGEALRQAVTPQDDNTPKAPTNGPPERRSKNPKHH